MPRLVIFGLPLPKPLPFMRGCGRKIMYGTVSVCGGCNFRTTSKKRAEQLITVRVRCIYFKFILASWGMISHITIASRVPDRTTNGYKMTGDD